MKSLQIFLVIIFAFQHVFADGTPSIKAQPYLDNCDRAMSVFDGHKEDFVEKKFVEMADTQEKMLQLVHDYNLLFTKEFAQALLVQLQFDNIATGTLYRQVKTLQNFSKKSPEEVSKYVWKALDMAQDLSTKNPSDALAQIRFTQLKNIIAALKASPNRRLFEDIAYIAVRASLIDYAGRLKVGNDWWRETSSRADTWSNRIGWGMFSFAVAVGIWAEAYLVPANDHPAGVFSGLLAGVILGGVATHFSEIYIKARRLPPPNIGPPPNFTVHSSPGTIDVASQTIFNFLARETRSGILSVQEGCSQNICSLTPVQIAYLGHVNVLELEALNKTLVGAMKEGSFGEEQIKVGEAARAVHDDPAHFGKQMILNRSLAEFLNKVSSLSQSREKAAKALVDYTASLSQNTVTALRAKPYKEKPTSDADIAKSQLLLTKIQLDLDSLEKIKINSQAIENKLQKSAVIIEKLRALLANLPTGPEGWKDAAEQVILELDELK